MKSSQLFFTVALITVSAILYVNLSPQKELLSHSETDGQQVPSISYMDILTNSEFAQEMAKAVRNGNQEKMAQLQAKAVEIGVAAGLDADQMNLLEGQKGLDFMRFRAKRRLFWQAFEYNFNLLLPIDDLKANYPEAADMFDKVDQLIATRDQNITEIAKSMARDGDYQHYLEQAKAQWLQKAADKKQTEL